ncbi:MAG: glycoside hydrolase family 16 protein [Candidatus Izimaplasma sp.]|nr:glycoside hydrolase family 16 protein [Candidatus Izimaplasma bacterium]
MKLIKHYDFVNNHESSLEDWNIQVGENWANNEKQHYVNKKENLYFDNGLVIKATYKDGVYESARLNTKGKFFFKYGKIEFIAKVPKGRGTWPALWMMSEEQKFGHWPKSGEIDVMEHIGNDLDNLFLAIHTEEYNHRKPKQYHSDYYQKGLTDDFHKYSQTWTETAITYFVDDKEVAHYIKGQDNYDTTHKGWPFDENFYILMNLAIGGKGGNIENDDFPQLFIIKDIKIFQ